MKKLVAVLVVFYMLCTVFIGFPYFTGNVEAIGQHEANSGTTYGTIQNETYDGTEQTFWIYNDSYVKNINPNDNFGTGLWIREAYIYHPTVPLFTRGLVIADLSLIPSEAMVTSAKIHVYFTDPADDGGITYAHRVTASWTELGVTWNNQPLHSGVVTDSIILPDWTEDWYDFNATDDVQNFVNGTHTNYGWKFISLESGLDDVSNEFYARELLDVNEKDPRVLVSYEIQFNVTRTAGAISESVNLSFIPSDSYYDNVTLKVPVSDSVVGIFNVSNNTAGIFATEVNGTGELVNNTFWYDASNQFVYIRTCNITTSNNVNWTVNCSYGGATFNINYPTYRNVGDYYMASGLIENSTGDPIDGFVATTRILLNGIDMISPPHKWNCVNGNYWCTISLSTLLPNTYDVSIEFTDLGTNITYKKGHQLYLSVDPGAGTYVWTYLHFTFYDNNTGIGIPSESFKIYASSDTVIDSSDRIYVDLYGVYTGQTIYYRIDDFFDNQIYPTSGNYSTLNITSFNQYEDVPIDWYSFSVKNMNHSIVWFNMTNGSRLYSTWLFPYEPFHWKVLSGEYNLSMDYYNPETDVYLETRYQNITIEHDEYYWIRGYDLQDIIIEIQITNGSLSNLTLTIITDISLVNSTVNTITTNIITNLSLLESNLTSYNQNIWNAINITDSIIDHINNTIWVNLTAINVTVDYIKNNININMTFVNSTIDYINNTIWNEMSFINTSVGDIDTKIINIWNDQNSSFGNLENRSMIIFSFYNTNEALGLDRETLKVYINGTRLIGDIYYANRTDVLNLTIKDYYNSTLYQGDHTVVAPLTFIDLGLTFHSWLFGNKNNIDYMISILKQGGSRWWERGIVPYGEREFIIPSGTYALRIYYNDSGVYTEVYNSTLPPSISVVNSKVYVIEGDDLVEVISGLSIIRGQLIEVRTELYDALMPDITIVCRNPPTIYSIYDKEGMAFGNDFYKICPPLITIATTRVDQYGNWINSTPMIPGNGSIANGTVTIIRDTLYLSGPGSITWVNITYTDNGTIMGNTSYIPSRVYIYGQNLTVNASGNISVARETKFNQVKKFDWLYYPFSGYGPDLDRAGWHSAGIEVINCLPVPLYEVFVIAGFSNKSNPDGNSVVVRDTTNGGIILKRGPDFDVTDAAIHFNLLSLNAYETRAFSMGYYKRSSESYTYDEGTVSVPSFEDVLWDDCSYNTFKIHWVNPYSTIFRGALYVKLNFDVPIGIDTKSMRVVDLTNDHEIDSSLFIPSRKYIRISAEAMGDVLPGAGRSFDVYFLMEEFVGADPKELHLNTQIFWGFTPFLIIFSVGIGFIILGSYFAASDKKEKKDRWKVCVAMGIFITVVFYILAAMGL